MLTAIPVNKTMKKALAAFLALSLIGSCAADACAEEIVIYSSDAFPPQIYLSGGKPSGFVPALFQRLSQDTGDTYRFVLLPWKRAINESTSGHGGIVNFSMTEQRKALFDFSDPLYKNRVELVVLKERSSEFRTIGDLDGKIFGIPLGASFGGKFAQGLNEHRYLVDADSLPSSRIQKLLLRRIDVAVVGQSFLAGLAKSDPALVASQDKLTAVPFELIDDWEYLAFPKVMHMQAALNRFNIALTAFKKTKEYRLMMSKAD